MPVAVEACRNIKGCLKPGGRCFCCNKGRRIDQNCITTGNPECPDYGEAIGFDNEELERLARHLQYN